MCCFNLKKSVFLPDVKYYVYFSLVGYLGYLNKFVNVTTNCSNIFYSDET